MAITICSNGTVTHTDAALRGVPTRTPKRDVLFFSVGKSGLFYIFFYFWATQQHPLRSSAFNIDLSRGSPGKMIINQSINQSINQKSIKIAFSRAPYNQSSGALYRVTKPKEQQMM